MKQKHYLSLLVFFTIAIGRGETSLLVNDALQRKMAHVSFSGAKADTGRVLESSHWGPCMVMDLENTSKETLVLMLQCGNKLLPQDTSIQTMMVTQTVSARVLPGQKKRFPVFAMCTEASDGSPSPDVRFKPGARATGHLLGIAELIQNKKYQNNAAQQAVWCLTDNYGLGRITDTDTSVMFTLRRFVAKAKGLPVSAVYNSSSDAPEPQRVIKTRSVYSGSLSYSVARQAKVFMALFDEDNHMKTIYVNNEMQREGSYTYNYQIGSDEMNDKKHYLRMFRDGKLEEEIVILPH